MPDDKCRLCNGTGKAQDPVKMGARMRSLRERWGVSQTEMCVRMNISNSLMSDLERGRRNWTTKRIKDYTEAVKK